MFWSDKILQYNFSLKTDIKLPKEVEWLYPYEGSETRACMQAFYHKYYNDDAPRKLILGINPGRFGAGTTGVPFTDPIRLEKECGIENGFPKKQELSSVFIYDMKNAYGGVEVFCHDFYISALCPLGFVKNGKNYNYYDDHLLLRRVEPFIVEHLKAQIEMGVQKERVFCLGQGKNFEYLSKINEQHHFFNEIIALAHPRWIMQYRLRRKEEFIQAYLTAFHR